MNKNLIIDDEPYYMSSIRELIISFNQEVLQITNVKRTIDYLKHSLDSVNIIILDLMIPFGRGHNYSIEEFPSPGEIILKFLLDSDFDRDRIAIYTAQSNAKIIEICKCENIYYLRKNNKEDDKRIIDFIVQNVDN